jgi:glycosyltransferase involved in cell wall biosynthesis
MKVLFDHQAFTIQEYGGISRYFYELTNQFQKIPEMSVYNSLLFSNNEYISESKIIHSTPFFKSIKLQRKIETMNLLNEVRSKTIYKQDNFDVFHPTYYDPYYLNIKSKKPIVITFHDIIHEKYKKDDHRTLTHKRKTLNRADSIIAVSLSSKNDLIEYYGIPSDKVSVIHLASSIASTSKVIGEVKDEDYLLFVGGRNDYKNFMFFVTSVAPLLLKKSNLYLYCVGGGKFSKEEHLLFNELKIQNRIKLFPGSDDNLIKFYSNALAFFFPSVYEGFGIPLLEAMNCGCPIGASETSSLPEVAGNAALYFNPTDKDSILSVAEILISQQPIRTNLIQSGFDRAKKFSWQQTARLTQDVYSKLM